LAAGSKGSEATARSGGGCKAGALPLKFGNNKKLATQCVQQDERLLLVIGFPHDHAAVAALAGARAAPL
jgi:hypothetical protein